MKTNTHTVGQLASRCGVAVKTVQFYVDEGLITPHGGATDAGYRLFTEDDVADLRAIRTFRALGFSLDAIRGLLAGSSDPHTAAQMQLEIVDTQLRALRRQRAILANALSSSSDEDVKRRLHLAHGAATLGAVERDAVIDRFIDRVRGGAPLEPDSTMRRMLAMDLPDELSDGQLEAWLELSSLVADESFVDALRAQHEPFGVGDAKAATGEAFGATIGPIIAQAVSALEDGCDKDDARVRALVDRWVRAFADGLGRTDDTAFRRWLVDYSARTNDPRMQRFWELIAEVKGQPPRVSPFVAAQQLLIDGLSAQLEST